MKENFIELTKEKVKVVVNLINVVEISQYDKGGSTIIAFNTQRDNGLYYIVVDENYEEVKQIIGLSPKTITGEFKTL